LQWIPYDHIEIKIHIFLRFAIFGVALKGRCKKNLNGCRDPVKKLVLAGKRKRMSWMEVKFRQFLSHKLDSREDVPHMGDMEDVENLLTMLNMMWCPRAGGQSGLVEDNC